MSAIHRKCMTIIYLKKTLEIRAKLVNSQKKVNCRF